MCGCKCPPCKCNELSLCMHDKGGLTQCSCLVPRPLHRKDGESGVHVLTRIVDALQANDSMVVLDSVPYGTAGPFAINVWVKVTSLNGEQFEYVFSHNATTPNPSSWGPSQVHHLVGPSTMCPQLTLLPGQDQIPRCICHACKAELPCVDTSVSHVPTCMSVLHDLQSI